MNIRQDFAKRHARPDVLARFGYPDRVGEIARMMLDGSATEEDVNEMLYLIDEVQNTWILEEDDEHEAP